jgi:hypothetical protein
MKHIIKNVQPNDYIVKSGDLVRLDFDNSPFKELYADQHGTSGIIISKIEHGWQEGVCEVFLFNQPSEDKALIKIHSDWLKQIPIQEIGTDLIANTQAEYSVQLLS